MAFLVGIFDRQGLRATERGAATRGVYDAQRNVDNKTRLVHPGPDDTDLLEKKRNPDWRWLCDP